jgi:ubiquinone/menaquinone biosynthesis C-methylase UbiE
VREGHGRRVQTQFGPSAADDVRSAGDAGGADLDTLLQWGRERGAQHVLDVATGGGHTALAFASLGARVVAFDLTEPMLRAARAFIHGRGAAGVDFVAGDVQALPVRDASFDAVTCRLAAHHFAEPATAIRQIARVLAPGGSLLLQETLGHDDPEANAFITEVERRRDPSHVKSYRAAEWKAFLRAAGLTIIAEARLLQVIAWPEWTERMRVSAEAKGELERFIRAAPAACREAFAFRMTADEIESYTSLMILLRADRD